MNAFEIKLARANGILDEVMGEEINRRIRKRYTLSNELAILRQRDEKPEEYAAYNEFVEQCKTQVKAEFEAIK